MIIRAVHNRDNPYFQMRRDTAQDAQLPARALGILVYLMSKPDDWEPTVDDICKRFPDVGRQQAYRIINDTFIPLGYARRVCERENGRVVRWVTEIYETPHVQNGHLEPPDDDFPHIEKPHVEIQHVENQMSKISTIQINRVQNTDRQITDRKIGADAPPAPTVKRKPAKQPVPPAIAYIRQLTHRYPDKTLWPRIIQTLGDDFDGGRLTECYENWVSHGWNKMNLVWLFEWYVVGVPQKENGNGKYQVSRRETPNERNAREYEELVRRSIAATGSGVGPDTADSDAPGIAVDFRRL